MLTKMVNGNAVQCSAEEESAIRAGWVADAPTHNDVIDAQIVSAENALPITPRALREFMLMVLQFAHIDPSVNPKFAAISALDARVQTLRGQRT